MAKTRGGIVKRSVPKASKNMKRKAEEVFRSSKKKKIVVEEPKSNSDSDTMVENDNYEDSSAQASDDVESSEEKINSGDEESSRDTRDSGDEDDDTLSLPICARDISDEDSEKLWLNTGGVPRNGRGVRPFSNSILSLQSKFKDIGTSSESETKDKATVMATEQKIVKLASQLQAAESRANRS
uniref:Uncharacterized protein n=1 Tax=Solanum tuberosum TaxID=4113 RepID=M1DL76_SOLTU